MVSKKDIDNVLADWDQKQINEVVAVRRMEMIARKAVNKLEQLKKQKTPKLTLLQVEDYEWLFVDGKMHVSNHSIYWPRTLQNLGFDLEIIDLEEKYPKLAEIVYDTGDLPEPCVSIESLELFDGNEVTNE